MQKLVHITTEHPYRGIFSITYTRSLYVSPSIGKLESCCLPQLHSYPLPINSTDLCGSRGSVGGFQD